MEFLIIEVKLMYSNKKTIYLNAQRLHIIKIIINFTDHKETIFFLKFKITVMKIMKSLFLACTCATLLIFANCGGGGGDDPVAAPTAAQKNATLLDGTWKLNSVTNEGTPRDEWTDFTLTLSLDDDFKGGNYNTTNIPDEDTEGVWASSGTFTASEDLTILTRNDGTKITLQVSASTLSLSFDISQSGGRVDGFTGSWVFNMNPS